MASFLVVIEKGQHSCGAYSPDLPGCVAVGDTVEEVEQRMREAILLHLEGMREDYLPLPQLTSRQQTRWKSVLHGQEIARSTTVLLQCSNLQLATTNPLLLLLLLLLYKVPGFVKDTY